MKPHANWMKLTKPALATCGRALQLVQVFDGQRGEGRAGRGGMRIGGKSGGFDVMTERVNLAWKLTLNGTQSAREPSNNLARRLTETSRARAHGVLTARLQAPARGGYRP